jgi:hypothetical protein
MAAKAASSGGPTDGRAVGSGWRRLEQCCRFRQHLGTSSRCRLTCRSWRSFERTTASLNLTPFVAIILMMDLCHQQWRLMRCARIEILRVHPSGGRRAHHRRAAPPGARRCRLYIAAKIDWSGPRCIGRWPGTGARPHPMVRLSISALRPGSGRRLHRVAVQRRSVEKATAAGGRPRKCEPRRRPDQRAGFNAALPPHRSVQSMSPGAQAFLQKLIAGFNAALPPHRSVQSMSPGAQAFLQALMVGGVRRPGWTGAPPPTMLARTPPPEQAPFLPQSPTGSTTLGCLWGNG